MGFMGRWLEDVKVRWKLGGGFFIVIALMIIVAILSFSSISMLLERFRILNKVSTVSEYMGDACSKAIPHLLLLQEKTSPKQLL
jgi:CHASE3 domain sensor protein